MNKQGSMLPLKGFSTTEPRGSKIVKMLDADTQWNMFQPHKKYELLHLPKKYMELDSVMVN